ncbi:HAD-IB family hydrolase [Lysobacter sp. GX 14042]|uniref:HAD family hydrolase n=1 Tax=Lysobacter sp. GX 14042 TaxID=2907155 RepID=UPI001F396D59|nr:HAD family hydrolase [Lysobacter sp. GX 14042]MCE7031420.1 HAD-IB family hydrolase [Lysobacter sp. GX 14042]
MGVVNATDGAMQRRGHRSDLALFDFDGTITTRETMPDFMYAAVRPGRQRLAKLLVLPLVLGYKAGLVSGVAIRAVICFLGFWRVPGDELEVRGRRFAGEFLPGVLRPTAMERIAWHKARGDTVVVVSGGLDVYLRPWCREQGLELLCSLLEQRGGRLTGRYLGAQCVRAEKARRVMARFPPERFDRVFAYGDTPEDRELLALAHEPHWFGKGV